eukprot:3954546-Pyramimonas_sp.AAC.1
MDRCVWSAFDGHLAPSQLSDRLRATVEIAHPSKRSDWSVVRICPRVLRPIGPQVIQESRYDGKVDVWALGIR